VRCPDGHESDDPDWCDVCGLALAAPVPAPVSGTCAACGAELTGRFCESCGHDALAPVASPAAPPMTWHAVVRADRAWFDDVRGQKGADAADLEFPRYFVERRFALTGARVAIGRRDAARGTAPDIDLGGLDPGVSAAHAVLLARPDGGWELVDVGSTNGTTVGDGPIPAHRPVPLADGSVVRLGAWTTITVSSGR
jgi:FHA domain